MAAVRRVMKTGVGPYRLKCLALAATLAACVLSSCSSTDDPTWNRIQETETLMVGMDASFPPFESIDADGSLFGFDVDLARELSSRLDVTPRFIANLPYDGLYDALTAGRVDIVISALVVAPSQTGDYAYSSVYFDAGYVLVARAGEETASSMNDLGGHSLAVALGTEGDREARRWARRLADLDIVQYDTPVEALEALVAGETDLALVDRVSALLAPGKGQHVQIVGDPVTEVPYACAVRRESKQLLEAVDEALQAMEEDGTMDELFSTWLR